tara:strand:+ start:1382 stop:2683 length:1302 start_codon:yes stop_codon:yes gene_type:complete
MEELYVVIANYGQGQQTVHPRTRDSRGTGAPIFGDPDGKGGITGLYTKAEADAIVKDGNRDKGFGSPHYHAKPLSVAHEYAQGLSGNLIRQAQSEIGVMGESKTVRIKKSTLKRMIRERLRGVEMYDGPNPPEAFPIRVGWDGGSFDARDSDELDMITRDLVSKGIAYSVDSVSDLEDEIAVGAGIEQYAESTGKIRIKKSELRKIIREIRDVPADVVDIDNGEVHAEDIFPADFAIWLRNNPEFREASADEIRSMQPGYDGDFRVRRRAMSEAPIDIPTVVSDQVTAANQEIQSLLQQIDVEEDPAEIDKINDRIKDLKAAVGELEKTAVEATGDTQVEGVLRAGLLRGIIAEAMTELENLEPVDYPHAYDEDAMTADLEASGFSQWSRDLARELGYNDPNEMPADMLSQELGMPYDAWKAGVAAKSYAKTI